MNPSAIPAYGQLSLTNPCLPIIDLWESLLPHFAEWESIHDSKASYWRSWHGDYLKTAQERYREHVLTPMQHSADALERLFPNPEDWETSWFFEQFQDTYNASGSLSGSLLNKAYEY